MANKANTKPKSDTAAATAPKVSKINSTIELLRREQGATLAELIAPTGWLPHSARAVLTGLRKKGHTILKSKREDATCYRITDAS